ncbi:hypothetical protein [Celeribacter sp.]|uniref:hypothetical protein n=1 Tax=Celeribacter sp. TaxID=1890673 RepID=UPI003A92EE1D
MSITRLTISALLLPALAACSGPGTSVGLDGSGSGGDGDDYTAVSGLRGTEAEDVSADGAIVRLHAASTDPAADYFLSEDSVTVRDNGDTLTIEGMPFDGDDSYVRLTSGSNTGTAGQNGKFFLYENAESTQTDPVGGSTIDQFYYIALHQSKNVGDDRVYVTIVGGDQSSDSIPLEGFVYGRTGGVVMATANQGKWTGDYAAVRTFHDTDMLDYVSGFMELEIDFEELNSAGAIRYVISDRQVFDINGDPIGSLDPIGVFAENGALDAQGEFQADANDIEITGTVTGNATIQGMLAGDDAEVAVGTVVMEYDEATNGSVVETGGFILDRNP